MRQALALCVMIAALGVGCGDEDALVVLHHTETSAAQCSLEEAREGRALTRGTMDLFVTNTYDFVPLVENASEQRIQLKGATFSFEAPPVSFPLPQGLFVPASFTLQPGERFVIPLQALPVDVGNILRESVELMSRGSIVTILIKATLEGVNEDGEEVRAPEFTLPVDLCAGCLLTFPLEAREPESDPPRCVLQGALPPEPCRLGQDAPVDCRLCLVRGEGERCQPLPDFD